MKSAIVENGVVTNVIIGSVDGSVPCGDDIDIGWLYDGAIFVPAAVTPLSLAEVKGNRTSYLDSEFSAAVTSDVTYGVVVYQSGKQTRENLGLAIANYISAGNSLPVGFGWYAKDNSKVTFTTTNISELADIVGTQWTTAFENYQTKKAAVRSVSTGDDAADIITVNAITG